MLMTATASWCRTTRFSGFVRQTCACAVEGGGLMAQTDQLR